MSHFLAIGQSLFCLVLWAVLPGENWTNRRGRTHAAHVLTLSLVSWTPSELGNGFTPLDAAVSTSADTTAQSIPPVSNQAVGLPAVCNYSFSKYLILEEDCLLFFAFPLQCGGHWWASSRHPQLWHDWEPYDTVILRGIKANDMINSV